MKYRIYLINFQYFTQDAFDTLQAAERAAVTVGFECIVYHGDTPLKIYSPISGWRKY